MTFEKNKTCCFTGHRIIPSKAWFSLEEKTDETIRGLIERGFDTFISGGALGFDTMAAQCVLRLKIKYDIKLIIAVPCREQCKGWNKNEKEVYENILNHADEVVVLSEEYDRECMHRRNKFMVDNSSACVAHLNKMSGGTFYTVNYAADNDKEIIFIR